MSISAKVPVIPIPDLRFEQTFLRSLQKYVDAGKPLTDTELALLAEDGEDRPPQIQPLAPITPGIVILAIVKDQILMPLLQGFLWSGFLLSLRPMMGLVVASGQRCGTWVANAMGLNQIRRYPGRLET